MKSPELLDQVWWRQRPWLDYGAKLVRYYSLRRYRLRYSPEVATAAVSHELSTVWLNPRWPAVPEPQWRLRWFRPGRNFHLSMLKGFIAHEAGHIRFSGAKPPGLLGSLWNMLEDERVERLMAAEHPELEAPFTLLGDLFALSALKRKQLKYDALEGCLYWRWCWDQLSPMWRSIDPAWLRVKPLVEQAWEAQSSAEVVEIARAILALLGLPEQAPPDPRFEHLGADGGEERKQNDGGGRSAPPANSPGKGQAAAEENDQETSGSEEGDQETSGSEEGDQGAAGKGGDQGANGGEGVGTGAGTEPTSPTDEIDTMQEQAAHILLDIDGYARDLAAALKPATASRLPRPHRSRGRFAYDRFKGGSERCYRHKPIEQERPVEVCVCLDLSGSMRKLTDSGSNLYSAVRACALLVQTCALASVPISVLGFNSTMRVVVERGTPSDEALLRLAGLTAQGKTELGPTLKHALTGADRNRVVVVICDGELEKRDAEACSSLVKRTEANVLPLLIGKYAGTRAFPGFERHLAVTELSELPAMVRAWFWARK